MRNAADRREVQRDAKRQKELARLSDGYWLTLLQTVGGRFVLWEILESCGVFSSGWDASARIHFNAGERNAGLRIMARITNLDEKLLFQMQLEASERARTLREQDKAREIEKEQKQEQDSKDMEDVVDV